MTPRDGVSGSFLSPRDGVKGSFLTPGDGVRGSFLKTGNRRWLCERMGSHCEWQHNSLQEKTL